MTIDLSISPCPNDTFMFDALLHGRIDTEGLTFEVTFADIEQLNARLIAPEGSRPAVSKASYAILPLIADRYCALHSGSALGRGNGPLLVTADEEASTDDCAMRIAVPGRHTTANLLLERLYPHLADKRPYLFSEIPHVVARGECDAGVLIHEGRFVYKNYGLHLMADLGVEWEKRTGLPLPLRLLPVGAVRPGASAGSGGGQKPHFAAGRQRGQDHQIRRPHLQRLPRPGRSPLGVDAGGIRPGHPRRSAAAL